MATAIGVIGAITSVASTGVQVATSIAGGNQQRQAIDEMVAIEVDRANRNAAQVRAQGRELEKRYRITAGKQIGQARANVGASGVTGGSAIDVLAESATNAERNALQIRSDTNFQADEFKRRAEEIKRRGRSLRNVNELETLSSTVGGVSNAVSSIASNFGSLTRIA